MTLEIFNYLPRTEPRNDKYKRKSNSTSSKRWPPSLLQRRLYLDKLSSRCFQSLKQRPRRVNQTKGRSTSHFSSPHSSCIVSLRYYRWQKPLPPTDNAQQQYRHVCISMPIELWEKCQHYELMIGGRWADSRGFFGRIIWATNPEKDGLSITAGVNGRRSFSQTVLLSSIFAPQHFEDVVGVEDCWWSYNIYLVYYTNCLWFSE